MYKKFEMELAGRTLRVDVGRVAKQANGAVLMHYGDTVVLSTATALTILSGGLLILSNALANLGGMTLGQIGVALAAMAGGLIEMGVALTLVKGSLGSATSFLIMSVVLNALVSPLKSLGEMSLEEIGHGLLAVGGALGIFAIAVGTMSLAGPIVIAVSAALSLLAGSFALLLGTMAAVSLMPLRVKHLSWHLERLALQLAFLSLE